MSSTDALREPECPTCGYILLGLTEHRCPECGAEFASDFVETFGARSRLLAWERRELGGIVRRFLRTIWCMVASPRRYFVAARARAERPIHRPWLFLCACIGSAFLLSVCSNTLSSFISFSISAWERDWGIGTVLKMQYRTMFLGFETQWLFPVTQIGSDLLAVSAVSWIARLIFRRRATIPRARDLVALLAPVLVLSGIVSGLMWIVFGFYQGQSIPSFVFSIMAYAGTGVLFVCTWLLFRDSLGQRRSIACLAAFLASGLWYLSSMLVTFIASQLYILQNAHKLNIGA